MSRVIVIGGGLSGLATAFVLQRLAAKAGREVDVTVLEAEGRAGGKIRTVARDGFSCEAGPAGFLDKEPRTFELCEALGLSSALLPASDAFENRYLFVRDHLEPVPMHPVKLARSQLLPWAGKLRLLGEPFVPRRKEQGDESIAGFVRRRIGPEGLRWLIDPMQSGIYAGDPERLSVRSCFPRVVEVEEQYGSLVRGMVRLQLQRRRERRGAKGGKQGVAGAGPTGRLTTLGAGMQQLTDALTAALGPAVRCGVRVTRLERVGPRWQVGGPGFAQALEAELVILAGPAYAAAELLHALEPTLAGELAAIEYASLNVACLGYRREDVPHPLDGFGFLVPRGQGMRLLGALFSSSIFPREAPSGQVLLRVMVGGARDGALAALDDDTLLGLLREDLARSIGVRAAPSFVTLFRWPQAIPQYNVGHAARLERLDARVAQLPGLLLTGNAYRGIGVNDCARNAWPVAERALELLARA